MPAFIRDHGFVDHLIRVAMKRGVAPVDAYRMATLNPATYIGREADLGGVAPGRYADLCLLRDLGEPRPEVVVARGRVAARDGRRARCACPSRTGRARLTTPEARLTVRWRARPDDFRLPARDRYPVIRLVSAVITRLEERPLAEGDLHAALVDRAGRWVAPALVTGFGDRVDGLASTITTDFNILVLGRRPESMARAVNRLLEVRGGVVLVDGDRVSFELPMPLGGVMTRLSLPRRRPRRTRCARRWSRAAIRTTSRCSRSSSWPPTSCRSCGSRRAVSGTSSRVGCCSRDARAGPDPPRCCGLAPPGPRSSSCC